MKLLGKKLYRIGPIKLYKGGFGGGAPGAGGLPSINVTPPAKPPLPEGVVRDDFEYQGPPLETMHDGPVTQPAIEPPQYSVGVPGSPSYQTFPQRPVGAPPHADEDRMEDPMDLMPPQTGEGPDPSQVVQRPTGEIPSDPVYRPWDEEESFSISEFLDDPGGDAPQPPSEIPWEQELGSLSGVWGGPGAEGPDIHHQAPPLQTPQRPVGNFPQRPVDHTPPEGPAGEGEVQTLRQTVSELRKEIASLRQQLAAAGGAGKPEPARPLQNAFGGERPGMDFGSHFSTR